MQRTATNLLSWGAGPMTATALEASGIVACATTAALFQLRSRTASTGCSPSGSNTDMRRGVHSNSRAFASQPAYAYDEDDPDHTSDPHEELEELQLTLAPTRAAPCSSSGESGESPPPWDHYKEQRHLLIAKYHKELFTIDQWVWSGQHSAIPFLGRSRFDPRTLHGPWIEHGSPSPEQLERHVEALASLPRPPLSPAAAAALREAQRAAQEQAAAAAAAARGEVQQQQQQWGALVVPEAVEERRGRGRPRGSKGKRSGGVGALPRRVGGDPVSYPVTLFDHPRDLARFPGFGAWVSSVGGALEAARAAAEAEVAAAQQAELEVAAEAARAALAEVEAAEAASRPPLQPPRKLAPLPSLRKLVDLSGSLPDVLRALRCAGLDADQGLEAALRRWLARVNPDARVEPRLEFDDKALAPVPITPQSASAMATLLLKELELKPIQARRLLQRCPWLLGMDAKGQAMAVVECLREIVELNTEQIGRMVMLYPRTLAAQVDDHLLPLLDYLHGLGFAPRNIRRMLTKNPLYTESFATGMLRTCVAFWLGKGMTRGDLVALVTQFPRVMYLGQTLTQLKFDWLREHTGCGVADHARNPVLLSRSLTQTLGPRISFALERGLAVVCPAAPKQQSKGRGARGEQTKAVPLQMITQISLKAYLEHVGASEEEFEAYKDWWNREALPAWLAQRGCSLEYYHSMAWLQEREAEPRRAWEHGGSCDVAAA